MSDLATPEEVTYETFVNELLADKVSKVDLYTYGEIDLTYTNTDGIYRGVDQPGTASEDNLLNAILKSKSVSYTAHDTKYPGKSQEGHNYMMWSSGLFFLVPVLLIITVIVQARTNSKLSSQLAELAATK